MCNPDGGIIDDLIIYKLTPEKFFVVWNAATKEKDFAWLTKNSDGFDVKLKDLSNDMAMIAVQGPKAVETVNRVTEEDAAEVKRFGIAEVTLAGHPGYATRTGYTGEDGFEVYVKDCPVGSPGKALEVWDALLDAGAKPCGLGARDSLRLEAGLNLSGQDIDESTNPLEAKLRWVVKFKKPGGFIGKEALEKRLHREGGAGEDQGGGREEDPGRHRDHRKGHPEARLRDPRRGGGGCPRRGDERRYGPEPGVRDRPRLRAEGALGAGDAGEDQDQEEAGGGKDC